MPKQKILLSILFVSLAILVFLVIWPFLSSIAWGAILVYSTWPLYQRLHLFLHKPTVSALIMTLILFTLLFLPFIWGLMLLQREVVAAYEALNIYLSQQPTIILPEFIQRLPWIANPLQDVLNQFSQRPDRLPPQIMEWIKSRGGELTTFIGNIGSNAIKFGVTLLIIFFFYRDGRDWLGMIRRMLQKSVGNRVNQYLITIGATTRAVVYGLILTAFAQAILAGVGYWIAGVSAPVLLTALTFVFSLFPYGTPIVWVPISLWLLITGDTFAGIGLLLWGGLIVSWIDNVIRPLVISNAIHAPFLLILLGVLGGVSAFGFIGLFIGPVILAVMLTSIQEWNRSKEEALSPPQERQI